MSQFCRFCGLLTDVVGEDCPKCGSEAIFINREDATMETFEEYQCEAHKTASYPDMGEIPGFMYAALGLTGEAGEVAEHIKKWFRDNTIDPTSVRKEIGDTLWYLAELCTMFGFTLDAVAQENIDKLRSRQQRSVIHGSGSDR